MATPKKDHPPIRIYGLVPYDRSAKARWLLTELGVDFETRWLNRENKENESAEFLRLNPMGRIPVLQIGDQTIFESGAICSYLGDHFSDRGLVPPLTSSDRAKYEQWMYFSVSTLDLFQSRIMVIEDIPAGSVQSEKEKILRSDLHDALTAMNTALERDGYLVAGRFSLADICVSYHLYWLTLWPELNSVIQEFPRVVGYLERMKGMPSAKKAEVFSYENA